MLTPLSESATEYKCSIAPDVSGHIKFPIRPGIPIHEYIGLTLCLLVTDIVHPK